jgi:hypothetical protein
MTRASLVSTGIDLGNERRLDLALDGVGAFAIGAPVDVTSVVASVVVASVLVSSVDMISVDETLGLNALGLGILGLGTAFVLLGSATRAVSSSMFFLGSSGGSGRAIGSFSSA